jgi:hypothetical protein
MTNIQEGLVIVKVRKILKFFFERPARKLPTYFFFCIFII